MFAVIGKWHTTPELDDEQHSGLGKSVAGYWTGSTDGASSHTFIVFDSAATAEAFASNVRGNIENQRRAGVKNLSLTVEEVAAHTTEPRSR